ncbi:hypothetical protein [Erythrobacter sp.]|uniref:hypothetical protein n=1 Tax=Erythrobacter sp. TaxID=1042 RepID=UPI0025C0D021|nr:hypothetical protein [Erythrobacter sp.]
MRAPESHRQSNLLLSRIAQALLGFTLLAFAAKAIADPAVQARYTPIVVLHATSMVAWLGLLASQAWLAAEHRLDLHKAFGRASMALVGAMAVSGAIISVNIGRELGRPEVTVVNLAAFVTFLPLYFAALHFARRRDMHAHRQAMLIGTLALMTPAYARVVQVAGLPDPVAIAAQVPITLAIALGYEWKVLGRVSKQIAWMLGFSLGVIAAMVGVLVVWFL